ncbi:50S ribosomal protein L6 [Candidatus Parcubacteria bacterium]|nr:50S ribosomal protein L6 [Patescibacteria group bacterium]MCG2689140.1 50S ribosomal protein L6 [Candidatus Parcubacteria bacterium]
MSKIGKMPIDIPAGVTVTCVGDLVTVVGSSGTLTRVVRPEVGLKINKNEIEVYLKDGETENAYWGLERALIANMVTGVSNGFFRKLELSGVGFRSKIEGNTLVLTVGYSHPVKMEIPQGLKVEVSDDVKIKVSGCDKQQVGQFSALIRKVRKPEPYKGKGIKYQGEIIRRKAGKAGKAGASGKT